MWSADYYIFRVHTFNKYSLSAMHCTRHQSSDSFMSRKDKNPCSFGAYILLWDRDDARDKYMMKYAGL